MAACVSLGYVPAERDAPSDVASAQPEGKGHEMTDTIRPRRSALYMPATNERALEKAKSIAADAIIIDLEDSIAPDAKDKAREKAREAVAAGGFARREVVVRVNGVGSEWHETDIAAVAPCGADAVCVPKVESAEDVAAIRKALTAAGAPADLAIWAMIETPLGILNVRHIAELGAQDANKVTVFLLGTNDLIKETRARATTRAPLIPAISTCILSARAFGLDILDGVYNDFRDEDGLRRECIEGRELGMDGKTLIHPNQIAPANEIFSPPESEVEEARKIIAAFEKRENRGEGVININGKMVELLHRDMALRTVAIAEAIVEASSRP